MKIYIICCVYAQILYWEKSCSWDVGWHALASQVADFLKQLFLQKKSMNSLIFCMLIQIHKIES